jgi:hypothetical protein
MEIFSIICLVVILITIQHLLNWGWRIVKKDKEFIGLIFTATMLSITITFLIIYHIILWGNKLL